jgi:rhodanese-related sulfurtransferase
MAIDVMIICAVALVAAGLLRRIGDQREFAQHTITAEELRAWLASNDEVLVVDAREPLDLLVDSVIIPGAIWLPPQQVMEDPSLLPAGKSLVFYCTCPSDKNGRAILHRALAFGFSRIKLLKGGLDGWRALGYPVEPYEKPFHLDSGNHLAVAS